MMARGRKVLIADHVPDLLGLFDTLMQQAGYRTATVLMHDSVLHKARMFNPDAILVDLISGHSEDTSLLDQLRTDSATRGTPVVAMSTIPFVLDQAVASYNVRQVLLKPFDVADLEEKTHAALERAPLLALLTRPSAAPNAIFGEVAAGLAANSREMMIRWVQRVSSTEPFRARRVNLAQTIDEVPILLQAVLIALQSDDFRGAFERNPAIWDRIAEHVQTRRKQGIPLASIVREYQFLREEIRCEIAGILHGKDVTTEDTLEVVTRKDYALDAIIRITVDTYERELIGQ